ncbi:MAG: hypothetical protein R2801_02995 [Chitinophagales bacterium]
MRKLKVGVWLEEYYNPEEGGAFGYFQQLIEALNNATFKDTELFFITKKETTIKYNLKNIYYIKTEKQKNKKAPYYTEL